MVNFFIDRPIFAWVIAIAIMLGGGAGHHHAADRELPGRRPAGGADPRHLPRAPRRATVDSTVTQVIEQKMVGLDGLLYMASESNITGDAQLTLTFEAGTDPDIAQVQVQNKLKAAEPLLPDEVTQQGVQVNKVSQTYLMVLAFVSDDGRLGMSDLADFVAAHVSEPLGRVDGVGDVLLFGAQHAMRVWLDPDRLAQYGLTVAGRQRRHPGAERAGRRRPARRPAGRAGSAAERHRAGAKPARNARAVRQHPAQGAAGRRAGASARCGAHRHRQRELRLSERLQRQAGRGHGHRPGARRQCARNRQTPARASGGAGAHVPARRGGALRRGQHAVREHRDQGSRPDAGDGGRTGVPGHAGVPAEPARHADPDPGRAGGAAGHVRHHCRWPASPSTC